MTNEQLAKARFFGRCLGMKVRIKEYYSDDNGVEQFKGLYDYTLDGIYCDHIVFANLDEHDLDNCQIIGRRISQMTDEERKVFRAMVITNMASHYIEGKDEHCLDFYTEVVNYFDSIGVFPDKYFELKWAVEEKK